jgi:hypothetical protein
MKPLKLLFFFFLPLMVSAQAIKIDEIAAKQVIDQMEDHPVEIIQVKTLKKWKALELSHDMKSQMNYNVVRVTYKTQDTLKLVIIDMHLIPIRLNRKTTLE